MKSISGGLATALAAEVTSKAHCWKITRRDGAAFYFTDHDQDLSIGGHTYSAAAGFQQTAIAAASDLSVNNLEVTGYFDSSFLTAEDLRAGLFDFAEAEIFVVDWSNLSLGVMNLSRSYLGEVRSTPAGVFTTELRGLVQRLMAKVADVWTPECRADFGSSGLRKCNKDPTAFTFSETVTAVSDNSIFAITNGNGAAVDGYYNFGVVKWLTGHNAGRAMEVKYWVNAPSTLQLYLPMPRTIVIGDTLTVTAGCDKTLTTCKNKFNNVVNRQAEDYIPGMDSVIQVPNSPATTSGGGGKGRG